MGAFSSGLFPSKAHLKVLKALDRFDNIVLNSAVNGTVREYPGRRTKKTDYYQFFEVPVINDGNPDATYYLNNRGLLAEPSYTEVIIKQALTELGISFLQEVSFVGCGKIGDKSFRFDFFIPEGRLIIEYDGATHNRIKSQGRDYYKDSFCRNNQIEIVRFNLAHYKNLKERVIAIFPKAVSFHK